MTKVKTKCSWCGKETGHKEGNFAKHLQGAISHGICKECAKDFLDDEKTTKVERKHSLR